MKIVIAESKGKTGKGKFANRLALALSASRNVKEKADVALHIGHIHYKSRARINVLRVGPAHIDTNKDYKKLNKKKWESVKKADAIVYQSKYSRKVYRKFVGKPKCPETVIFNGADPTYYKNLKPLPKTFKYNFLASTRTWLPQKRLKDIIKSFLLADISNARLWIAGDAPISLRKYRKDARIFFLGLLNDETLGRYYKMCDALIHMVYLDACPNTVVESLVAGCPVICTSEGGTQELLDNYDGNGKEIIDKCYGFKPINLEKPPKIDKKKLSAEMVSVTYIDKFVNAEHLHINNVAKQYLEFFKRIS